MKSKIKGFVFGMIIGLTLVATLVFASSGLITKQLSYDNIKIELDGKEIVPKDANGNYVEPFTIDGTTYLPVRAVSGALGLNVDWDDKTNTVLLSTKQSKPSAPAVSEEEAIQAVKDYVETTRYAMGDSVGNDQFSVDIEARGTVVVYKYTFKNLYDITQEEKEIIVETFENQKQEYDETLANSLKLIQSIEPNVSGLIYEYLETDGDLLFSLEVE